VIARGSFAPGAGGAALPGRRSADPLPGVTDVAVRVVEVTVQERTPHRHPRCAEVVAVLEGTGVHWQAGETVDVGPGDVVHVPAGVAHVTLAASSAAPLRLLCFFGRGDLPGNLEELEGPLIRV
jgi:mannose-6-phosphate isomerase-like protein (cupin superfamily)